MPGLTYRSNYDSGAFQVQIEADLEPNFPAFCDGVPCKNGHVKVRETPAPQGFSSGFLLQAV